MRKRVTTLCVSVVLAIALPACSVFAERRLVEGDLEVEPARAENLLPPMDAGDDFSVVRNTGQGGVLDRHVRASLGSDGVDLTLIESVETLDDESGESRGVSLAYRTPGGGMFTVSVSPASNYIRDGDSSPTLEMGAVDPRGEGEYWVTARGDEVLSMDYTDHTQVLLFGEAWVVDLVSTAEDQRTKQVPSWFSVDDLERYVTELAGRLR